jgi:pyruvate/2-oxoglutarate dehydrogenase complex dihydrolipoamide dehydrogenase (E3) component
MVVVVQAQSGSEFAGFYRSMGTEVILVEFMPRICD